MKKLSFLLAPFFVAGISWSARADVVVDDVLPAGNIVFEKIEGDTVSVHQDLRDTTEAWFYWGMRVTGAAGRTLTFKFTTSDAVGVRGPVVTTDCGQTYNYGGTSVTRKQFTYAFGATENETWFYECIPYMPSDWTAFLSQHEDKRDDWFETGVLCQSSKTSTDVPEARFGCISGTPKYKLLLSSRHHCSETVATYVLEGIAAAFLKDDDLGAWLRANVLCEAVPFVDYDGVVAGDQGKSRSPHDHNRDYTEFIYTETKALAALATNMQADVWFDIHCPWLYNAPNEYLYTPKKDPNLPYIHVDNESRFSQILQSNISNDGIPYSASHDIDYGTSWNTAANYSQGWSSIIWGLTYVSSSKLCRTFEVPFANADGTTVTQSRLRVLGNDIAKSLKDFFLAYEENGGNFGEAEPPPSGKDLTKLPDDYTELEYVQSTHEQHVDTMYVPNARTKIVATFSVVEYNEGSGYKGAYIFGCYGGNNAGRCQFRYGQPLFVGWGLSYDNANFTQYPLDVTTHTLVLDKGSFSIDGGSPVYSKSWAGASVKLLLFGSNPNGGTLNPDLYSKVRLYSLVISEDGVEKRHYIPALDGDGGVGLYDTVEENFVMSAVTGKPLVAGPTVGPVSDAPRFVGFSAGGNEKGVWGEVSVRDGKDYGATVEAYIGADPASWTAISNWAHSVDSATYAATNSEVSIGATYYCAFKMTYEKNSETIVKWTSTNTVGVTGIVHWSGAAGDGRWTNAGNWNEGIVPTSLTSDYFSRSGTTIVKAGDEALYGRGVYVTQGTVVWDFTSGTALTNTWLHIGGSGGTSGTLIVSNGVLNTTAVSTDNNGAPTFDSSYSTFELVGTRAKFGNFNTWMDHCEFHLLDGACVEADSICVNNKGWSSQILVDQESCLRVTGKASGSLSVDGGSKVVVDGGAVTNWGVAQLSVSDNSSGTLIVRNGGVFAQRCTTDKSFAVGMRGKGRVFVTDGGLLTADKGIWLGYGSDNYGLSSFVDLTNGTVRTAGLHVGFDTRYNADYSVRVIGESALLDVSSVTLGAEAFAAGKYREAGSAQLEVDGGTVQVKNAIKVGTVYERVPDVLKVMGLTAKVTAGSIACTTNAVVKFVVPANGFANGFEDAVVDVAGDIDLSSADGWPTPVEIDATTCASSAWQTLMRAGGAISNLVESQISVSVADGRNYELRLVKDEEEKVTALQFRVFAAPRGTVIIYR